MMAEPAGTQNESDGVAFKVEGDEHARARRYEEADRSYTRSLVAAPHLHTTWGNRSLVRLKLGMADAAAGDAQQCTALAPDWPKGWARRGAAERARRRPGVASESYARALALEPDNQEYERLLAEVRAESIQFPDAPADEDYSGSEDEGYDDLGDDGPWADDDEEDHDSEYYYYSDAALPPQHPGGVMSRGHTHPGMQHQAGYVLPGGADGCGASFRNGGGVYFGGAPLPSVIPSYVSEAAYRSATVGAAHYAAAQGAVLNGSSESTAASVRADHHRSSSSEEYGDGSRGEEDPHSSQKGRNGGNKGDKNSEGYGNSSRNDSSGSSDALTWERSVAGLGGNAVARPGGGGGGGSLNVHGPSLTAIQEIMAQCLEHLPLEERAGLGREEQLALMMATLEACPSRFPALERLVAAFAEQRLRLADEARRRVPTLPVSYDEHWCCFWSEAPAAPLPPDAGAGHSSNSPYGSPSRDDNSSSSSSSSSCCDPSHSNSSHSYLRHRARPLYVVMVAVLNGPRAGHVVASEQAVTRPDGEALLDTLWGAMAFPLPMATTPPSYDHTQGGDEDASLHSPESLPDHHGLTIPSGAGGSGRPGGGGAAGAGAWPYASQGHGSCPRRPAGVLLAANLMPHYATVAGALLAVDVACRLESRADADAHAYRTQQQLLQQQHAAQYSKHHQKARAPMC